MASLKYIFEKAVIPEMIKCYLEILPIYNPPEEYDYSKADPVASVGKVYAKTEKIHRILLELRRRLHNPDAPFDRDIIGETDM